MIVERVRDGATDLRRRAEDVCVVAVGEDAADLAVTKSVSDETVFPGGDLTYTVTVTNNGPDPATSVVDSWGRAHDHENFFVVGAPTCVSASCANATLTFCALSLRSASEIARGLPAVGARR